MRSLAIIACLRLRRSSATPAAGPISMAGMARESITPLTTMPGVWPHGQAEHGDVV